MSRVFVDTSAVIALLVAADEFHQAAKSAFAGLSIARPFLSLMSESGVTNSERHAFPGP